MRTVLISLVLAGASWGCSPCESLEQKICDDLGEEGCKIWKDNGMVGMPSGRRAFKACVNSSFGATYQATLTGARATVQAMKDAEAAAAKRLNAAKSND